MTTEEKNQEKRSGGFILPALLALLLLGVGYWGYSMKSKSDQLLGEKSQLTSELSKVSLVKEELKASVDSLNDAYSELSSENSSLKGDLKGANARVKNRERRIAKLKKQLADVENSNGSLSQQIQILVQTKAELESTITDLEMENDSLETLTVSLTQDLTQTKDAKLALERMNNSINEELKRLTLANFKATAFNVTTLLKNGKQHMRARRVRKVKASFDLMSVPEKYQGVRPVYMVITDEKATPIVVEDAINASIKVNGQNVDIQAVEAKEINISDSQRLSFTHDLAKKLKPGYYRVAVYTDIGMLGASSFRLR